MRLNSDMVITKSIRVIYPLVVSFFPRLMSVQQIFILNMDWTLLGQLTGTCKTKTLFKRGGGHKKSMDYILKIVWETDKAGIRTLINIYENTSNNNKDSCSDP